MSLKWTLKNEYRLIFQRILSLAVLCLFFMAPAMAALDFGFAREDGGQAGAFLEFANSARSLAMAGASTAVSDDASAVLSNPAGLSQIERKDFVASYSTLFEDSKFSVINYAQPTVDMGTFGIGLVSLQSGSFDRRDNTGSQNGSFGTSETAFLLSHGFELGKRLSLGSGMKVIREQVDNFSSTGYGLDGAALLKVNSVLTMGLTLRNLLAPTLKLRNENDRYPLDLRVGSRWQANRKLMVAMDLNQTANRSIKFRLGAEWTLNSLLALRVGVNETEFTTGLGFKFKDWGVDYSFGYNDAAAGLEDLGSTHRMGIHLSFGKKVSEQSASVRWQKKGQEGLVQLRKRMVEPATEAMAGVDKLLADVNQVIRRQGYLKAADLYSAQGYVSYFEGSYERSVQSLGEALTLSPQDAQLAAHLEKARAQMTEERTQEVVSLELKRLKDLYAKSDWKAALKSCEKILSFVPNNIEASMYIIDVRKQINEPIEREMKIAVAKFDREEYLDAIKSFQKVKELSPENKEAADYITKSITALEQIAAAGTSGNDGLPRDVFEVPQNTTQSQEFYKKGLVSYSEGNLQEAAKLWEKAVEMDTHNASARNAYNRAQIELREKP